MLGAGMFQGKLYSQATWTNGVPIYHSRIYDGATWSNGPELIPNNQEGYKYMSLYSVEFAGKLVYMNNHWPLTGDIPPYWTPPPVDLISFDGSTATTIYQNLWDFRAAGDALYVLGKDSVVKFTNDLANWTVLGTAPTTARSIAVLNGKIYVGTTDSKIYEFSDSISSLPSVVVNFNTPYIYEDGAGGSFTITRFGSTTSSLTVNYSVQGTAIPGTDFQTLSGSVTIPAGQDSVTVPLVPVNDSALEMNEWIRVVLNRTANYEVAEPSCMNVTLYDDDRPTVAVTASDATATEAGPTTGAFRITRSGSTVSPLTVTWSRAGSATAGSDYTTLSSAVVIPAGQSSVTVPVSPIDDTVPEGPETVFVKLGANAAYNLGESYTATVTLTSDDLSIVTISASDSAAAEVGGNTGRFTLSRQGDLTVPLTVNLTVNGTATSGSDYKVISSTATIPANYSSYAAITITPLDDLLVEGNETVVVILASGSGYVIGSSNTATVNIADNDTTSTNTAPVVNAGADQTITLPATANLDGTVSDDGLPNPPAAVTTVWSKVSGPTNGTVTFANSSNVDTTASFSVGGIYVLRLSANDGALSRSDDLTIAVNVSTPPPAVAMGVLAGGENHSLAVSSGGAVWSCGQGSYGQLGAGNTNSVLVPQQIPNFNATEVSAGRYHSLALRSDGTVWTWGYNGYGQLGLGTTKQTNFPVKVSSLVNVAAIGGGYYHSAAVTQDGKIWTWGLGSYGQLGNGTTNRTQTTPIQVLGLSGQGASVSAGVYHSVALQSDGTVWTWGYNKYGQLGQGYTNEFINSAVKIPGLSGVSRVVAGDYFTAALKTDGSVWAWGYNGGRLGDGTSLHRSSPVRVTNLTNVAEIYAGWSHMLAVKQDGTVWSWGVNSSGQLGNGTWSASTKPIQVTGLSSVVGLGSGAAHSLALKNDGTVWSWGKNNAGQLGNNSTLNHSNAVQVSGLDLLP
jgi:alpha-tubulin suppressor-like RCC1 family protein